MRVSPSGQMNGTTSAAWLQSFEQETALAAKSKQQAGHDVVQLISDAERLLRTVRDHVEHAVLQEADLHWSAFLALHCLWSHGTLETRRLAAKAGMAKSTLSGILNGLERRGLLRRRTDADDCRLVLVNLTAPGKKLMRSLMQSFAAEEAHVMSLLVPGQPSDRHRLTTTRTGPFAATIERV
ncbi:MAG: winged helix-turn-helix transcriptional regulator [Proteobacteria bacterium]|nr:winged helix-turn-helix transcriptional regulator [Pseudomonadota bacterium]